MTSAEARDQLLAMIGLETPNHASPIILNRILSDLNATLQKIWTMSMPWWSEQKTGSILHAPKTFPHFYVKKGSNEVYAWSQDAIEITSNSLQGWLNPTTSAPWEPPTTSPGIGVYIRDGFNYYSSNPDSLFYIQKQAVVGGGTNASNYFLMERQKGTPNGTRRAGIVVEYSLAPVLETFSSSDFIYKLYEGQFWRDYFNLSHVQKPLNIGNLTFIVPFGTPTGQTWTGSNAAFNVFPDSFIKEEDEGKTIRFSDDPTDNEISHYDSKKRVAYLVRPYMGNTKNGLVSGTIYGDVIKMPINYNSIIGPVFIAGEHELKPLRSSKDVLLFSDAYNFHSYSENVVGPGSTVIAENRDVDVPIGYYVESARYEAGQPVSRLRVSPLPEKEYLLRYQVRLGAPKIAALDSTEIPIPQNYAESILLPILRYQFSTWRHINLGNQANEYKTHYDEAWQILGKLKPQPIAIGRVRVSMQ